MARECQNASVNKEKVGESKVLYLTMRPNARDDGKERVAACRGKCA